MQVTWDRLHLVPVGEELLGGPLARDPRLKVVRRNSPYASEEEYMDTYFRLLRAECFSAVQEVGRYGIHR